MTAFLQGLIHGEGRLWFYTDHANILKGLRRGERWCCDPRRNNVDLWKDIWKRIDDHGGLGDNLRVTRVSVPRVRVTRVRFTGVRVIGV